MIPVRDTIGDLGPIRGTLALLAAEVVAFILGLFDGSIWVLLLVLAGTWLFGSPLERRLGTPKFLLVALALFAAGPVVIGLVDGESPFTLYPLGAVGGMGLVLIGVVPRARILFLSPIPFAMGFYEVPAWAVLAGWAFLAWLAA
ncbi:MAG: hypothetical protein ACO3ZZ_02080 [Solirubrobacterales bacterium]